MTNNSSRRRFIKKSSAVAAGLAFGLSQLNAARLGELIKENVPINWRRKGRKVAFKLSIPATISNVEVRLYSNANNYIFEYDDVSPHAPRVVNEQTKAVWMADFDEATKARKKSSREQRFPVVDVALKPDMSAVIEMDVKEPGVYNINDHGLASVTNVIRIPYMRLEHWGNSLVLDPKSNSIKRFYIASNMEVDHAQLSFDFETLRDDWSGLISVHNAHTKELLASGEVSRELSLPEVSTGSGVSRQRMIESLSWATKFILDCENTDTNSEAFGGEYLLYDLSARTRLRPFWSWAWGPSAKMLLAAAAIKGVDAGQNRKRLKQRAIDLMDVTLNLQVLNPSSPAYGIIKTSAHEASTVDSLFLAGWGWMPLYKETGNPKYIDAGRKLADAANRLMDEHKDVLIPQAYLFEDKKWKDIMSFESSMGLPGLAGLYLVTGDEYYKKTTIRLADLLIRAFEQSNGLWGVFYYQKTQQTSPVNYWTKAFGYIVDGLIEAHKAAPEQGYLEKALVIAEQVLKTQANDGSLSVRFDRSSEFVGVGDKATALWGGLYIRLYKMTRDKRYYTAGMKAIEWCMDYQYFGDDSLARGGIVGRSWPSGINFRHWFDVVVTYTVSFFGNALAEALSLDEWN